MSKENENKAVNELEYSESRNRWIRKDSKQFASKEEVKKYLNLDKSTEEIKTSEKYSKPTKTSAETETSETSKRLETIKKKTKTKTKTKSKGIRKTGKEKTEKIESPEDTLKRLKKKGTKKESGKETEKLTKEPKLEGEFQGNPVIKLENVEIETDNSFGEIDTFTRKPLDELAKKVQIGYKGNGAKDFRYIATEKTPNKKKGQFIKNEYARELREKRRLRRSVRSIMKRNKNKITQDQAVKQLQELIQKEKELKRKGYSPEQIERKLNNYKQNTLNWQGYQNTVYAI